MGLGSLVRPAVVPTEFQGATPAALSEAAKRRKVRQSQDTYRALRAIESRLIDKGLCTDDGQACPFAVAVVAAYQRHNDTTPTVGFIRTVANERRAELDLPLLPEPETTP